MSEAAYFGFAVSSATRADRWGRPADHRHVPDEQPLGHADVGVAGPENLLHPADAVRASAIAATAARRRPVDLRRTRRQRANRIADSRNRPCRTAW